jgi:NAD(P)H-dependent flavin oxidoreductase YrpB (nitropropane dioxygenase family)
MNTNPSPYAELGTPLCDLLSIRYPVVQVPMAGGWTKPDLSARCPSPEA